MDEQLDEATREIVDLAKAIVTGGEQGAAPGWWETMQAARYLHVPPWEFEPRNVTGPAVWRQRALVAIKAEHLAGQMRAQIQVAAQVRQRQGGGLLVPNHRV